MEIFIYNNEQNENIKLPVIPDSVGINSPQSIEMFETINQGNIALIGKLGNRKLTLEAFFAVSDAPYLKDKSLKGMQYLNKLQEWRNSRKPLYIYISDLEFATRCVIDNIEYEIKDGSGDIYYTLKISEYIYTQEVVKRPQDKPKTADNDNVTISKDGYVEVDDNVRNNIRGGAGIGYEVSKIASNVKRLRTLRRYGEYVQVKGGWILSKYLK